MIHRLTERQKECLRLVGQGYTSKEIGRRLAISPATVDNHIRPSLEALNVDSRAEAARLLLAAEDGQSLTSQPPALAGLKDLPSIGEAGPAIASTWRRLVPPMGGTPNDRSWEAKSAAIIRVALLGFTVFALLTLGVAFLLWALR
ncbi:MAG: LuxR family transcriptional regulator [Alphaproteobacteria bacterium]|nr:MAG: LuxR family transcriptional regulator [Alphaproteobacteria bacterium]